MTADEMLKSDVWTYGEKAIVKWQFHLHGNLFTALFEAFARADEKNLYRLSLGFPQETEALREWRYGSLAKRLREAGLEI